MQSFAVVACLCAAAVTAQDSSYESYYGGCYGPGCGGGGYYDSASPYDDDYGIPECVKTCVEACGFGDSDGVQGTTTGSGTDGGEDPCACLAMCDVSSCEEEVGKKVAASIAEFVANGCEDTYDDDDGIPECVKTCVEACGFDSDGKVTTTGSGTDGGEDPCACIAMCDVSSCEEEVGAWIAAEIAEFVANGCEDTYDTYDTYTYEPFVCGAADSGRDTTDVPTFSFAGCEGGSGDFQLCLDNEGESVTVGEIPAGMVGLRIDLKAETDLDIRIYDVSDDIVATKPGGQAVVAWCKTDDPTQDCGGSVLGSSPLEDTAPYRGMEITYSGYMGTDTMGTEYIIISGRAGSTVKLRMEAFAFKTGSVAVTYSWTDTITECCAGTAPCTGKFTRDVSKSSVGEEVESLGDIPTGVKDLKITLTAEKDLDIFLYDPSTTPSTAVVAYGMNDATGLGEEPFQKSASYQGLMYTYSGYNGVNFQAGNEQISIDGITDRALEFRVFGYEAGSCTVEYEYFMPQ